MLVDSNSLRYFLEAHSNPMVSSNSDLDSLVLAYRQSRDEIDFSNICNRAIGVVISLARFNNAHLDEADIYSYTLESLLIAVDGWNPEKTKFITYYHACVLNLLWTLKRKKSIRDYNRYMVSLDQMVEENGFDVAKTDKDYSFSINFNNHNKEKDLVEFIKRFNVTNKAEICRALGISSGKLGILIRSIKKQNKKLV